MSKTRTYVHSAADGFKKLPRGHQDELRRKVKGLKQLVRSEITGVTLREWRKSIPSVNQDIVAIACGVSQALISDFEKSKIEGETLIARLKELYVLLAEPAPKDYYVDPASGRTPEEELADFFGSYRALINKYRPLLGKDKLESQFESLLLRTDKALETLHPEAVRLSRAVQHRSLQQYDAGSPAGPEQGQAQEAAGSGQLHRTGEQRAEGAL